MTQGPQYARFIFLLHLLLRTVESAETTKTLITITITILVIIHRPVFYLKRRFRDISSLRNVVF
jgi:hypothetical protein